ncbi:MAG: BlaI/MecI/CopY family transcriptional regulator [Coriobacteriales bacterium]|jgi:predicted transcriptional regulator|nr:BlaI/MecI/CopY family transcriptional regulator [Coriobacteriales bacterium]
MVDYRLTKAESSLAEIIWSNAPLPSAKLVSLAADNLGWKRTTTYTILKKLCEKGIAANDSAMVSALLTHDEFLAGQSSQFVENSFGGSLPRFVTAFIDGGKLTKEQAAELRRLIDEFDDGEQHG